MTKPTQIALSFILIVGSIVASICYLGHLYPPYVNEEASSEAVEPQKTFEDLLDAISWVESRDDPNAVGDNGEAVGVFQIHKIYMEDVNRIDRMRSRDKYTPYYPYKDYHRKSPHLSRYMVKTYLEYYATRERIGRKPAFEDMARIHNGGPNGYKKESTKAYWEKVKARLEL